MKDDDDKYLDPARNPFIKAERPDPGDFDPSPDGRAPFPLPGKESGGGELGALLDKAHPEGGHVEVAGLRLLRLAEWAFEDGKPLTDAAPAELARIRKALE